jgi:catechol 2,3-dioxygenase-like lactoylglutathione lyase family enzyme
VTKTRTGDAFMPADEYGRQLPKFSVNLLVRSIAESLPFYTGVLGATVRYSDNDFAAMRLLDWEFMLHADHSYDHQPLFERFKNVKQRGAGAEIRILGIDPVEVEKRARAAGSDIVHEAKHFPHGWHEISVADPDGYVWVVGVPNFWINELSLSSKTFEQYVSFLFDRAVVDDKKLFDCYLTDLDGSHYEDIDRNEPAVLVEYMTRVFSDFGSLVARYSHAQVDQGVWGIWGPPVRSGEFLFSPSVPLSQRLACIRSMYTVYKDYVPTFPATETLSGFYMWWDLLLMSSGYRPESLRRALIEEIIQNWTKNPELCSTKCLKYSNSFFRFRIENVSLLHYMGLGHLDHPQVPQFVQQVIDSGSTEVGLKSLEDCRDGNVL